MIQYPPKNIYQFHLSSKYRKAPHEALLLREVVQRMNSEVREKLGTVIPEKVSRKLRTRPNC